MRRSFTAALVLTVFGLVAVAGGACGGASEGPKDSRLAVIATIAPVGALVQAAGGELISISVIAGPGQDPHEYEVTASDRKAIGAARLVFRNGLGIDDFLDDALADDGEKVVTVSEGLPVRKASDGRTTDSHVWQDAENAQKMVRLIAEALAREDPANAEAYRRNAEAHVAELAAADREIRALIDSIPPANRKVVTNHDALGYFLDRYGLTFVGAVIPSQTTQAEPSAKDIADLIETIKREGVRAIFAESSLDPKVARQIASDTGVKIVDDLYGDSLGEPGSGAETVPGMLLANAKKIAEALK
jgi:zinc/manganese transport system substrate-binding protein